MRWAKFWAILSQTHLVTLVQMNKYGFRVPLKDRILFGNVKIGICLAACKINSGQGFGQSCQTVYFQTKNPYLGKFWRVW
jgi:hypothetical protein